MKNPAIIGKFTGECADSSVTNANGLDITREVWETVFNSEEYKTAIENGHYIGYLGHPEDPNCMDFKNACIVMTEGHIDDDGKVYGEFNLVDTPVGRVVKSFIDAGVTFGISVRGAGDIIGHEVDPETFVFRGFDIVTFPAYKTAIPEFQEIAASSDLKKQETYKKICASVKKELNNITSCESIDALIEQFPKNSETRKALNIRKSELVAASESFDLEDAQKSSMIKLYLQEKDRADKLQQKINAMEELQKSSIVYANKKLHVMHRIVSQQETAVEAMNSDLRDDLNTIQASINILKDDRRKAIHANKILKSNLEREKSLNLQYRTKIEAADKLTIDKDKTIRDLQTKLDKTVIQAQTAEKRASDLDGKVKSQKSIIEASEKLIEEYQDAYASLYSKAIGVDLKNVSVTASTSVKDLQKRIVSSSNIAVSDVFVEPQPEDIEEIAEDEYETSLVTA